MGRRLSGNGGGGGALRAKIINAKVPLVTGLLTTVSSFGLLAPVTFARTGGNANLALASNGQVSATAALAAGTTQSINGTATGADGVMLPFTANLTGQPTLGTLALSATTVNTTASVTINIIGSVLGSTISGAMPPGMTLSSVNRTISGTPTATGTYEFDLVETLAGAFGSPKTTRVSIVVTAVPTMEIGIGMRAISTYDGYYPFANVLWSGSKWYQMSGASPFTSNFGSLTPTNNADVFMMTLCDNGTAGVGALPGGTYTVYNPDGCTIGFGPYNSTMYTGGYTTANTFTFDYTPVAGAGGLYMMAKGPVTGALRVIMPGHVASWAAGNIWNQDFLNFQSLAKPRVLRFMDWLCTNNSIIDAASDFPTLASISLSSNATGGGQTIALAAAADLCNRLGADLWFNVPVRATDAALDAVFATINSVLSSSRKVYVEYGNETWNTFTVFRESWQWVRMLTFTTYMATATTSPGWNLPAHGLTNGEQIACFQSKANFGYGYDPNSNAFEGWKLARGLERYAKVIDANNFELYQDAALTVPLAYEAGRKNLIYKRLSEAGKVLDGDGNYSTRSMQAWAKADAVFGRARTVHICGTQVSNTAVTSARMAVSGMSSATDYVAGAPYYAGEWWLGMVDIASGQLTPKVWSVSASRAFRFGLYAAGSTPTMADVLAGTGAGFINGQNITSTGSANSNTYVSGTAVTGLANGTAYEVRFVYTDGDGAQWMASGTATVSAAASTVSFNDPYDNQKKRNFRNIAKMAGDLNATRTAAGGKALACYEIGSDYFGPNYTTTAAAEIAAWRAAYTQSQQEANTFAQYYKTLAASDVKVVCQFNDVGKLPGCFNMAESLTDTADLRFQFYASQNGAVPKITTPLSYSNLTPANIPAAPSYPYTVVTLGASGVTYSIYSGDPNGNFAVVGNELRMVNGHNISWVTPTVRRVSILADDGYTSAVFTVQFTTGLSWFENDALFAWDSTLDTDTAVVNPQIGANMPKQVGTGATASGGTWTFPGDTYYSNNGVLSSGLDFSKPFLWAAVLDPLSTPANRVFTTVGNGPLGVDFSTHISTAGLVICRVTSTTPALNTGRACAATAQTGLKVYWAYYDGTTMRFGCNQTENAASALTATISGTTVTSLPIGGAYAAASQGKHGSMQLVSRTEMTLADAKAIVAKMQALHSIP